MIKNKKIILIVLYVGIFQFVVPSEDHSKGSGKQPGGFNYLSSVAQSTDDLTVDDLQALDITTPNRVAAIKIQNRLDKYRQSASTENTTPYSLSSVSRNSMKSSGNTPYSNLAADTSLVSTISDSVSSPETPQSSSIASIKSTRSSTAGAGVTGSSSTSAFQFSPSAQNFVSVNSFTTPVKKSQSAASASNTPTSAGSIPSTDSSNSLSSMSSRRSVTFSPVAQFPESQISTPIARKTSSGRLTPISRQDRSDLVSDFDTMVDSPGGSKKIVAKSVVDTIVGGPFDQDVRATQQKELLNTFHKNAELAPFFSKMAEHMSPDEVKEYAVAIIDHAMTPRIQYNKNGTIKDVGGGHNMQKALQSQLIQPNEYVFVGQDNKTVGVSIAGIAKTIRSDFDEDFLMNFMQNGTFIAQDPSSATFKINEMPLDNSFIGTYQKPGNPFIYQSLFPVMVVNGNLVDKNKQIYVGRMVNLDDGSVPQSGGTSFMIGKQDFHNMMKSSRSQSFKTIDPLVRVVNITTELNYYFYHKLKGSRFPVPIFGILDNRKA